MTNTAKITVTLLKSGHVHQGKAREKDDSIEVTERQIAFLVKRGLIAQPSNTKTAIAAGSKPADAAAPTK